MLVANPRKQKLCIQVKDSVGLTDVTIGTGEVGFHLLQSLFQLKVFLSILSKLMYVILLGNL